VHLRTEFGQISQIEELTKKIFGVFVLNYIVQFGILIAFLALHRYDVKLIFVMLVIILFLRVFISGISILAVAMVMGNDYFSSNVNSRLKL
jgi:hypothetical protein